MIIYISFALCFLFYCSSASPLAAAGGNGDKQTLSTGQAYSWGQWKLVPADGTDVDQSLYLWSDAAALELSHDSNGWYNFLLDGEVSIMWSIGDYTKSPDRKEYLEKLQHLRNSVIKETLQPILTKPGPNKLVFGAWTLTSEKENELIIKNSDATTQKTILRENFSGFIFVPVDDTEEKLLKAESFLDDLPELAMNEEVDSPKELCDSERTESMHGGDAYSWGQWMMVPKDGWLYVWRDDGDAIVMRHNGDSNGWFDFLLDGKVSTMYSSGSYVDDSGDLVGGLQHVKSSIESTPVRNILSKPGCGKFVFGNWILSSKKEGDLLIHNSLDQRQTTTLRNGLSGFIFQSVSTEEEIVLTSDSSMSGADQFGKLQQTTTLAPLEITETYIPADAYNPKEPCGSECAPREPAAADPGSTLHFGSLVGGELQRLPQRERLQVMVSILRVLREHSPKQGSACTADLEDSPVY